MAVVTPLLMHSNALELLHFYTEPLSALGFCEISLANFEWLHLISVRLYQNDRCKDIYRSDPIHAQKWYFKG